MLVYRNEYQVERSLGRLKGRPLSLTPMYMQRDDHATGLIRLLSIALRVVTLLECVVRHQLTADGSKLAGLYTGNAKWETARPTAERLLEAFQDILRQRDDDAFPWHMISFQRQYAIEVPIIQTTFLKDP